LAGEFCARVLSLRLAVLRMVCIGQSPRCVRLPRFNANNQPEAQMAKLHRNLISAAFTLVALLVATAAFAADDAKKDDAKKDAKPDLKVIKPEEAKDHDGEVVIVEFKVSQAREIDSGVCFLNSAGATGDPKRFTAFITGKGMKKFKEDPKTEKPADMFKGKKIQVSGAIKKYKESWEIEVNDPTQIKIVEEKKDEKPKDEKPEEKKS
jgi:DNA/RNA endonuclease YhcR with UshA esterase domain